ncbi:MAG: redoxin domain-containing protein [Terriglobales bacterium]
MPEETLRGVLENGVPGVGDAAPDFELPALIAGVKQTFRLSAHRGQSIALAFYPFNWQQPSAAQLMSYQAQRPRVLASHGEIVTITVDSIMNITAWEREIGPFDFAMCSDFWPHGEVSERYGVLRKSDQTSDEDAGASERAVVIVDPEGAIVFRKIYRHEDLAPVEEMLAVLQKI